MAFVYKKETNILEWDDQQQVVLNQFRIIMELIHVFNDQQ